MTAQNALVIAWWATFLVTVIFGGMVVYYQTRTRDLHHENELLKFELYGTSGCACQGTKRGCADER
jgi:hypothetical protein